MENKTRFVQVRNPKSKNYIRIDTLIGQIVGRRKQPYKCPLAKHDKVSV